MSGRVKIPVRGTRAYLAGLGTSGSLLAGAAVLFLIGSAIVAFRGWPQIGVGPASSNISAAPLAASARASQRLTVVLADADRHTARTGTAGGGVRSGSHSRTAVKGVSVGSVRTRSTGTAEPTGMTGTGAGAAGAGGSAGGSSGQKPPQQLVSTTTKTVSSVGGDVVKTVSDVGNEVGAQLTDVTGAAAQQVGGANQPVGSVVSSAGSTVSNTVTGTVSTATTAASGLTGALGLGGH